MFIKRKIFFSDKITINNDYHWLLYLLEIKKIQKKKIETRSKNSFIQIRDPTTNECVKTRMIIS
jgi:hypothetical protein